MAALETIRRVTVQGRSDGLDKLAADLRGVSAAQQDVARTGQTAAQVTDMTSRRQLSAAAAVERYRAGLEPAFRAQQQFERGQRLMDRALQQGVIDLQEHSRMMALAQARLNDNIPVVDKFGKTSAFAGGQLGNLAYQINDIGTMLAMGASPFQIMASQGGQIVQIFGSARGGVGAALKELGQLALGLAVRFAPVIGAVGLVGAAVWSHYSKIAESEKQAEEAAKLHKSAIDAIKDAYGDAAVEADKLSKISKSIAEVMARSAQAKTLNSLKASTGDALGDMGGLIGYRGQQSFIAAEPFRAFEQSILKLRETAGAGLPDVLAFRDAVASRMNLEPNNAALQRHGQTLLDLTGDAAKLAAAYREMNGAMGVFRPRTAGDKAANGRVAGAFAPIERADAMDRLRAALSSDLPKKGRQSDYERDLKSLRDRTAELRADEQAVGRSTYEAARLTAQMDLENAARKDSIGLTAERTGEIAQEARAYAEQIVALEKAEEAMQRLDDVRSAFRDGLGGMFSDLRDALRDGASFWTAFGDAAANAVQKIADRLTDLAVDGLLDQLLGKQGAGGGLFSSLLGGLFGSSSGPSASAVTAASTGRGIYHGGGVIGRDAVSSRFIHPAYFDDAPRFHGGGIVGRERPIIANEDEGVFTPGQMKALGLMAGSGGGGMVIENHFHHEPGLSVTTKQTPIPGGIRQDVAIRAIKADIANDMTAGRGDIGRANRATGGREYLRG